jgi:hypothetical protein
LGLKIAASFYNKGANANNGKVNNVIFGKVLGSNEKECMVWDVERGIPDQPQVKPWQTCTCIGDWHYNRATYTNNWYKSATTVIHMLIDIVSKNGNLLLNIPLRGDGTYDEKELAIVQGITAWMNVNKESIYETRPWTVFGEGPTAERANGLNGQGFNEGTNYDASDIRYVGKGDSLLYVTVMGWPTNGKVVLRSLRSTLPYLTRNIKSIQILGGGKLTYTRTLDALTINLPATKPATGNIGIAFKISLDTLSLSSLNAMIKVAEVNDSIAILNTGADCGQYTPGAVAALEAAITEASTLPNCNCIITGSQIDAAIAKLQNAIIAFQAADKGAGGFTPLYSNLTNMVPDTYLSVLTGFGGWGHKAIVSGSEAFCGSSCKFTATTNGYPDGAALDLSNVAWAPNATYRYRAVVRTVDGSCAFYANGTNPNYLKVIPQSGSDWVVVDQTFTTGSNPTSGYFSFNNVDGSVNGKIAYIDNYELYNITSLTALQAVGVENQNIYIQGNSIVADFELAQPSEVEISVFNAQGILLKKVNGKCDAGNNHKVIPANLTSGVYLVVLNYNGRVVTKKLVK